MSLTFRLTGIQLVKSHVTRDHHIPDSPAEASININLPRLVFNEGTPQIEITVEYVLELSTLSEDGERVPIGEIATAFDVSLSASSPIDAALAQTGALNPAQEIAINAAHSYQRMQIASITAGLFPQPVNLPLELDGLEGEKPATSSA